MRVRLITTAGKPRNLAAGRTGDSGVAAVEIALPAIGQGVAAVVVQAQSGKDTAETRQAVGPATAPATAPAAAPAAGA